MTDFSTFDVAFAMTGDVYRNSRALKQLESLTRLGLRVVVLCLEGEAPPVRLPGDVEVRRMPVPEGSGPGFFRMVHRGMSDMLRAVNARWIHASDLYVVPACARRAKNLSSVSSAKDPVPWSYDSRELYAHVAATAGRPWVSWFWRLLEGRYIRRARVVFTVSDRIADHLAATYGIPRPVVVRNVPPRSTHVRAAPPLPTGPPVILHLGQMRASRGLEHLIAAMAFVPGARLVFMGYGAGKPVLETLAAASPAADRIEFRPPVPPADVPQAAAEAWVGVTLLEDSCLNHRYALPNKLFEYLAAGVPVVASDLPEIRAVLESTQAGMCVDPSHVRELAAALQHVCDNQTTYRPNARRAAERFNWENEAQAFVTPFQDLL
ncbi:MAG: glycosyltransferase [Rhodothermales bacterium]